MGEACGVWLNTALVPLKTKGLAMWRILLSESQERMLLAVPPEKLQRTREILARHLVRGTVVGRFAQTGRYTVVYNPKLHEDDVVALDPPELPLAGEVGIDTPYCLLKDEPESRKPVPAPRATVRSVWPSISRDDLPELLTQIVRDPEVADQSIAGRQYDSSVQGITCYGPYGVRTDDRVPTSYWACQPLYGKPPAAVFTTAFNPWLFEAHPQLAARQCFLEALTKQVLAGVKLCDIALCDNFYTPHKLPGGDHWLVAMVDELAALVETFGTPLISGKDSSAGSTDTPTGVISVPPSVFISALGKVPIVSWLLPNEWHAAGNLLVRIGLDCASIAGTVMERLSGKVSCATDVDDVSTTGHREFLAALENIPHGVLQSGVPIGPGGILAAMFRGALASGWGVELMHQPDGFAELVKEHRCGAIVEVPENRIRELPMELRPHVVARILDEPLVIRVQGENVLIPAAIDGWRNSYPAQLALNG
jgi:phosphoribosylformylglycinamidine synthase